jgi:hypothetical protein
MGVMMSIDLMTGEGSIDIQYCSDAFKFRAKILAFIGRLMESNRNIRINLEGSFTKYDQNKIVNMIRKLNNKRTHDE